VLPRSVEDIAATVAICREHAAPRARCRHLAVRTKRERRSRGRVREVSASRRLGRCAGAARASRARDAL